MPSPTDTADHSLSPAELLYYALVLAKDSGDDAAYERLKALHPDDLADVLDIPDDGGADAAGFAAEWTPGKSRTGEPGWVSSGGQFRKVKPGGAGTGEPAPAGAPKPKPAEPAPKPAPAPKPKAPSAAEAKAAKVAAAQAAAAKLTSGAPMAAADLTGLDDHFKTLTAAQLKDVARALKQKLSGTKQELADRLVAKAKELAAAKGTGSPAPKTATENEYVAAAKGNARKGDPADLAQQLASMHGRAAEKGDAAATAALEAELAKVGAEKHGPAKGEPTQHSNKFYDAPAGVGPGDPVTVARQPIVRDGKVLAKGEVTPAGKAPAKAEPAAAPSKGAGSVAKLDDAALAKVVQQAADEHDKGFGGNKVFIADVYDKLKRQDPTLDLDEFKSRLNDLNRDDRLTLSRADLVQLMHPDDVQRSETVHPLVSSARNHFILAAHKDRTQRGPKGAGAAAPAPSHERPDLPAAAPAAPAKHPARAALDALGIDHGDLSDADAAEVHAATQAHARELAARKRAPKAAPAAAGSPAAPAAPAPAPAASAAPAPAPAPAAPPAPKAEPAPKATVPTGQKHVADVPGGAVVGADRKGELSTHFAPGQPEAQAKRLGAAIRAGMADAALFPEASDGLVPLGLLASQVRHQPGAEGASDSDILAALAHLQDTRQIEGQALNETQTLAKGKNSPLNNGDDLASATLWRNGRAVHFFALPRK